MSRRTFDNPDSIEARQAILDNRCERLHPKRHRTKGRTKRHGAAKRAAVKHKVAARDAAARAHKNAARAFWTGHRDEHP